MLGRARFDRGSRGVKPSGPETDDLAVRHVPRTGEARLSIR